MNYLEQMIAQYFEWKGCVVKTNINAGKRKKDGWSGELDVVVYDPKRGKIFHYEPSTVAAG